MIDFLRKFNTSFQITLDGGRECHNKTRFLKGGEGTFNQIISNIIMLANAKCSCIVRINYTAANIESASETIDLLKEIPIENRPYISFDFQRVWQERESKQILSSKEISIEAIVRKLLKRAKESGFRASYHHPMSGIDNSCYGDKRNHLLINSNGDIYNCTARDFIPQNRVGFLSKTGEAVFENDSLTVRMNSKFNKQVCYNCRIASICGGGCRQQAVEHLNSEECMYGYSEEEKDRIILNLFENQYITE